MHIAIFGCGQLAQMTARSGMELGHTFSFIADEGESARCVEDLGKVITAPADITGEALYRALQKPDVVTVEKEMVNTQLLSDLQVYTRVSPGANAIYITQNRIREKQFLRNHSVATAEFEIIDNHRILQDLPKKLGLPIHIKAVESGYDGYRQWRIKSQMDLQQTSLLEAIDSGVDLVAEKHVNFLREISVIAARSANGDTAVYPIMENRHEEGVLLMTMAPAVNLDPGLQQAAVDAVKKIMVSLNYIGVLTMECFDVKGKLVVNELAPRVHNSGHWTIEAGCASQFENHCRAITDMTLGSTAMQGYAGLVNMLGQHADEQAFANSKMFYHAYGKEERPRRKLGHITICNDNRAVLTQQLNQVMHRLYGDHYQPI